MSVRTAHWLRRAAAVVRSIPTWECLPILVIVALAAVPVHGQVPDPTEATNIQGWAKAVFQLGIILIVLTAAIFIALGAYMYLAAAGDASAAQQGKEYIRRALMGLVLGLVAWIILNTIRTQFTELKAPQLGGK